MSVTGLRAHLAEVLNEVHYAGARTFIARRGQRIAAIVPAVEAEMLEAAEDAYLLRLAEPSEAAQGDKPHRTLSEVLAEYVEDLGEDAV